jgi:hypothetical protein
MRLHGKGTGREGERGLQTWDACKACVTGPNMAEGFAFTGVTHTHASLRQLKENGAKTGSDGLSAEEGGGTGGARMQNRLFADAYLDAYPKNALFWGGRRAPKGILEDQNGVSAGRGPREGSVGWPVACPAPVRTASHPVFPENWSQRAEIVKYGFSAKPPKWAVFRPLEVYFGVRCPEGGSERPSGRTRTYASSRSQTRVPFFQNLGAAWAS